MGSDWKVTTIGAVACKDEYGLVDGPFGSNLPASSYTEIGIPVIRGSNLAVGPTRFNSASFVYVGDETAERLSRSLCKPDDIIFTKKGTLGQTGLVPHGKHSKYLISSNQMKLRVDRSTAFPLYVYYYVSSPESVSKVLRDSEATGVPKTNLAYLKAFPIRLPPISIQKAIAHILGTLDDKIELNRRMNETLESMARALFKSWFVDFDPVVDNALAAGNPIPEPLHARAETRRTLAGKTQPLPAHIQKLFPDAFHFDEEMGWIPEGWGVSDVGSEFQVTMGQSPPGHTYNQDADGTPFFQGSTDFGFRYPTKRVYCTAPKRMAEMGDTLVSVRAPVGDVNMAAEFCCVGRGVAAVRHRSTSRSFTYYSMIQLRERFKVYESEGTVFGSINQKGFNSLPHLDFPADLITGFEQHAGNIDEKIEENSEATNTLTKLRDTLLPKLLSGELRIPDAEQLVAGSL